MGKETGLVAQLKQLDELIRGKRTDAETLAKGTEQLDILLFAKLSVLLGMAYGVFMGLFAVFTQGAPGLLQMFSSMLKVPLLFLLTLLVTCPSLYVFGALLGARHGPHAMMRILIASIAVNLAILASFGPITGFFTLTTTSYPFMKLLNVVFFGVAGFLGVGFLRKTLFQLELNDAPPAANPSGKVPPPAPRPRDASGAVENLFQAWLMLYAFVGVQMGWILRPFVGSPDLPFAWLRQRGGNFFVDIWKALLALFGG